MNESQTNKRKTIPQWQLERMQMLIATHWDEILNIVNLRITSHDSNYLQ